MEIGNRVAKRPIMYDIMALVSIIVPERQIHRRDTLKVLGTICFAEKVELKVISEDGNKGEH